MKPLIINYDKSISKKRIVYKITPIYTAYMIFEYSLMIIWITVTILVMRDSNIFKSVTAISIAVFFIISSILFLGGRFFLDKLVFISGKDPLYLKSKIADFIRISYPNIKINDSSQRIITARRGTTLFSWGKEIIVLLSESGIYINIRTYGRFDFRSPLHAPFHYLKCLRLKKSIEGKTG